MPIQLAAVLDGVRHSGDTCGAGGLALATPRGRALIQRLYQMLDTLRYHVLPSGHHVDGLSARTQCGILITYFQLSLGEIAMAGCCGAGAGAHSAASH